MKYFLSGLDLIGFVALSMSAVLVSSVLSLVQLLLRYLLRLIEKILKFFRLVKQKILATISRAAKNDTDWIVIRFGKFSILLGKKNNASKSD